MGTYSFSDLKVKLGSCFYLCSGEADFEIEDQGIGSYEFHGAKGNDSYLVAAFDGVSLSSYDLLGCYPADATGEPLQGLTAAEVKLLEEGVIDILSADNELSAELVRKALGDGEEN